MVKYVQTLRVVVAEGKQMFSRNLDATRIASERDAVDKEQVTHIEPPHSTNDNPSYPEAPASSVDRCQNALIFRDQCGTA